MVKPVSLSDPAFAALRREKQPGESDSDVVLRLIATVETARREPRRFLKFRPTRAASVEAHLENIARMDDADRKNPWTG